MMNNENRNHNSNIEDNNYENEIQELKAKLAKAEMENNELKQIINEQESEIKNTTVEESKDYEEEDEDEDYEEDDDDEEGCPYCGSNNVEVQLIRKGMTLQGTLLFLSLLMGGLTIPIAIWYWIDCNALKEHGVCINCGNTWIKKKN